MLGIFPSYSAQEKTNTLPIPRDIAIDFATGEPIIKNNDFVVVEKDEAIKVWCYYALKINRDKFIIYSPQYGSTLEDLIGNNYIDAYKYELEKRVSDCLLVSPYIKSVDKVESNFDSETGELTGDIYITTIYSEGVEVNV